VERLECRASAAKCGQMIPPAKKWSRRTPSLVLR
jgi:hypothetical protein